MSFNLVTEFMMLFSHQTQPIMREVVVFANKYTRGLFCNEIISLGLIVKVK